MTLRISLLVMLVSFLGCVSEIQRAQTIEPDAQKAKKQQQQKKPDAIPTFTYRRL